MTVKQFLSHCNICRSQISSATVVNVNTGEETTFKRRYIIYDAYGDCGAMKINSYTITEGKIVIYAR